MSRILKADGIKFRTSILIILVGIMIFLFSTQTEIYTNTLAIITSASILIPAALRLLGIFQTRQAISKTRLEIKKRLVLTIRSNVIPMKTGIQDFILLKNRFPLSWE